MLRAVTGILAKVYIIVIMAVPVRDLIQVTCRG